jgi:hypothetical protein
MTNGNDYANPSTHQNSDGTHDFNVNKGLTKREYFAAMAMQGILANHTYNNWDDYDLMAKDSCYAVDAIIAQLNKTETK